MRKKFGNGNLVGGQKKLDVAPPKGILNKADFKMLGSMNKKAQELAMHEKDTGSSEIQIALLTEKIETLSKHIKQFKKDKHSSVGLLRAVNRRKKLLDYLKRNKVDSYKNVLSKLNLRK